MTSSLSIWFSRHLQVLFDSLGRLWQVPVASGMTILVLAIAMSLPLILYKIVTSLETVTEGWTGAPRITLFLKSESNGVSVDPIEFGQQLLQNPKVDDVEFISPEQGLLEFSEVDGFADAVAALPENPLPPVLVVFPATGDDIQNTESLAQQLETMEQIDTLIFDQKWLYKITAMVELVKRGLMVFAALMGVGILLVISNTVRLGITNRADEIEIIDQVGGTHAFIRRPFLYTAAVQCVLGTLLAWCISATTLYLMAKPVARLAALYESDFAIGWIGPKLIFVIIVGAVILGLIAARVTVDRYLNRLRPGADVKGGRNEIPVKG